MADEGVEVAVSRHPVLRLQLDDDRQSVGREIQNRLVLQKKAKKEELNPGSPPMSLFPHSLPHASMSDPHLTGQLSLNPSTFGPLDPAYHAFHCWQDKTHSCHNKPNQMYSVTLFSYPEKNRTQIYNGIAPCCGCCRLKGAGSQSVVSACQHTLVGRVSKAFI